MDDTNIIDNSSYELTQNEMIICYKVIDNYTEVRYSSLLLKQTAVQETAQIIRLLLF